MIAQAAQDHDKNFYPLPHEFFVQQNDIVTMVQEIYDMAYMMGKSQQELQKHSEEQLKELDDKLTLVLKYFEEKNKAQDFREVWPMPPKKGESK